MARSMPELPAFHAPYHANRMTRYPQSVAFAAALLFTAALSSSSENLVFPPGSPPADTLDVIDLRGKDLHTNIAAATFQGVVNSATRSRVFLVTSEYDRRWLERLRDAGKIRHARVWATIKELFVQHRERIDTSIVFDPQLPASVNVATTMAGPERAVVLAPELQDELGLGKPVIDLRGRWKTNVEAQAWAWETYRDRLSSKMLACYAPTACMGNIRDFIVRNRIFTFWITGKAKADGKVSDFEKEKAFAETILAETPPNIPVIGFWYAGVDEGISEYNGVGLGGLYGKFTVVFDWGNNASVYSGIPVDLGALAASHARRVSRKPPKLDPAKVYLTYNLVESGDAPHYWLQRQSDVWLDENRGRVPINWSLGPTTGELLPLVLEWYYENATPQDYFFLSISGAGYCHPYRDFMTEVADPESAWRAYLELTHRYMRLFSMETLGLYTDAWKTFRRSEYDQVTERFLSANPELISLQLGMGRDEGPDAALGNYRQGVSDTLVSHIQTRWETGDIYGESKEHHIQWLVEEIRRNTPDTRPAFMQTMAYSWVHDPTTLLAVTQRLGEEYVPLTVPQFVALYRNWEERRR